MSAWLRMKRWYCEKRGHGRSMGWWPVSQIGNQLVMRCVHCGQFEAFPVCTMKDWFASYGIYTDDILP